MHVGHMRSGVPYCIRMRTNCVFSKGINHEQRPACKVYAQLGTEVC